VNCKRRLPQNPDKEDGFRKNPHHDNWDF